MGLKSEFVKKAQKKPSLSTDRKGLTSDPAGTRTPNLLLRRELLYPVELRDHNSLPIAIGRAKVKLLW